MPQVSVVIPAYNAARYLGQAIDSVLQQSFQDFEVIIVDDGSTDETASIVQSFADPRVHYLYQDNQERSRARNRGVSASTGEYIAFIDADDYFYPQKLAWQVAALNANLDIGLVAGGLAWVDDAGKELMLFKPWLAHPRPDLKYLLFRTLSNLGATLIRKRCIHLVGGFAENLSHCEDWDFWLRLAVAGCRMAWTKEIVLAYRIHSENSVRQALKMRTGAIAVLEAFFNNSALTPEIHTLKDAAFARAYLEASGREFALGQVDLARTDLELAVSLHPLLARGHPPPALDTVIAFARSPFTRNLKECLRTVSANLPEALSRSGIKERHLFAHSEIAAMFEATDRGESHLAWRCWRNAVALDPAWLTNRGVVKVGLLAFGRSFSKAWRSKNAHS